MNNRGYSSGSRRRPKKRITGRFYAFLTVVVVLVVMLTVVLTRGSAPADNPILPKPSPASNTGGQADATATPEPTAGSMTIEELIQSDPDLAPLEGDAKVKVDSLSITEGLPGEWTNILLLGSDTRNVRRAARTDTIIIAAINTNDGRIKLISIMRDTIVPIPGYGEKKINSASYYGGPELTMKVVNECFKMNISKYVLVNFSGFREMIDTLGGIELDVTKEEMEQINGSLKEQGIILKLDKQTWLDGGYDLKTYGADTPLDGLQALAYARIRHIDSDYQRTERQRKVIDAAIQKFRGSVSITQLMQLTTSVWDYVQTDVTIPELIGLARTVLQSGIGKVSTGLMPISNTSESDTRAQGSGLYDTDFAANAARLYKFIYEE